MLDIKWILDNPEEFKDSMSKRGIDANHLFDQLFELNQKRKNLVARDQDIRTESNNIAKTIGQNKTNNEHLITQAKSLKLELAEVSDSLKEAEANLSNIMMGIPNILSSDVPNGGPQLLNPIIRKVGILPSFDFQPKEHYDLGENLGLMSFEDARQLSGSRFVVTKGALAQLERAIVSFMLNLHTKAFGYVEVNPPVLVKQNILEGTGQLPKFEEDLFRINNSDLWLVPTAEVPLTNLVNNKILNGNELPIRLTAHTLCFRAEAGSAGRDTRGMIRQHQFQKVELVSIVQPDESNNELDRMLGCAEEVLKQLKLPYQVVLLCSEDIGFAARKTYDIEVWLPGQNQYREISSCSNCWDFQARRMKARFKNDTMKKPQFVHTLNGSGLAVGRTLIAILENYQQEDGSILVPEVLQPYMGGLTKIEAIK